MGKYELTITPANNGFILKWTNLKADGMMMTVNAIRSGIEIFTETKALHKRIKELTE